MKIFYMKQSLFQKVWKFHPEVLISLPELQTYIKDFGLLKDDFALVAEIEKQIVGAVWVRIINDYGHIDSSTPSLAISLYKDYRKHGI